jgi:hypothetical protein
VSSEANSATLESATATSATTRQQLEATTQSNAKMKQLILRANKHIEDNKKRMQLQSQQVKDLRNHVTTISFQFHSSLHTHTITPSVTMIMVNANKCDE